MLAGSCSLLLRFSLNEVCLLPGVEFVIMLPGVVGPGVVSKLQQFPLISFSAFAPWRPSENRNSEVKQVCYLGT